MKPIVMYLTAKMSLAYRHFFILEVPLNIVNCGSDYTTSGNFESRENGFFDI